MDMCHLWQILSRTNSRLLLELSQKLQTPRPCQAHQAVT